MINFQGFHLFLAQVGSFQYQVNKFLEERAFLTRESGGMLPVCVVSLLQAGRITRYTAIIETPEFPISLSLAMEKYGLREKNT